MTPLPQCCNPFDKKCNRCAKTNLTCISGNYNSNVSELLGLYACVTCKRQLYRIQNSEHCRKINNTIQQATKKNMHIFKKRGQKRVEAEKDDEYVCKAVDDECKRVKLASALQEMISALPAKKFTSIYQMLIMRSHM